MTSIINTGLNNRPALSNVYIHNGSFRVCNLEQELTVYDSTDGDIDCLIPFATFAKFAKNKDAIRYAEQSGGKIELISGKSKLTLPCFNVDFPEIPDLSDGERYIIDDFNGFITQLDRVSKFANKERDRYDLNCVLLENSSIVATDRVVLRHEFTTGMPVNRMVLPLNSVKHMVQICKAYNGDNVQFVYNHNIFSIVSDEFTYTTRTMDTQFPRYTEAVDKYGTTTDAISIAELKSCIDSLNTIYVDGIANFSMENGLCNYETPLGKMQYQLFDGDHERIGINLGYLEHYMNSVKKIESMRFGIQGFKKPFIMKDEFGTLFCSPTSV